MSVDGGRHWQLLLSGYDRHGVHALDFANSHDGWASLGDGSLGGGLIVTIDGTHWGPP